MSDSLDTELLPGSSFTKLGLKPDMVAKAIPIVTEFVSKGAGADVGKLLAGVLK